MDEDGAHVAFPRGGPLLDLVREGGREGGRDGWSARRMQGREGGREGGRDVLVGQVDGRWVSCRPSRCAF